MSISQGKRDDRQVVVVLVLVIPDDVIQENTNGIVVLSFLTPTSSLYNLFGECRKFMYRIHLVYLIHVVVLFVRAFYHVLCY